MLVVFEDDAEVADAVARATAAVVRERSRQMPAPP
jgi:hypothetical protein